MKKTQHVYQRQCETKRVSLCMVRVVMNVSANFMDDYLHAVLLRAFAFLSSAVHSRDCFYFSISTCNRRENVRSSFRYCSADDIAVCQESTASYIKVETIFHVR